MIDYDLLLYKMHFTCFLQIQQDYAEIFSSRSSLMYQKWPAISACILSYANSMKPDWKKLLQVEGTEDTDFNDGK